MDISRYLDLKAKGAVSLMAIGRGHFAFGLRRYDAANGNELEPECERVTRENVEVARQSYVEALASCDELLKDMDAEAAKLP